MAKTEFLASLTPNEKTELQYRWDFWGRNDQQLPPGAWQTWIALAGRGWGKTRTGAEAVRSEVESGRSGRIALVAPTAADVRDVMVEGESGILATSPPWNQPKYEPSKRRLTWPNGAMATTYSADQPDRLRGPQHDFAWADELAAWRRLEAWDMLQMGLRIGTYPRTVTTTTPRPLPLIRQLLKDPTTIVTHGSTRANFANLSPNFMHTVIAKYQGTRLGRQELEAEILDDVPGALWTLDLLDQGRVAADAVPPLERIVIGVDPSVSDGDDAAETGIVVAGKSADGHGYVLADCSVRGSPRDWALATHAAFAEWKADRVIAEANQGGTMVEHTLRTVNPNLSITLVHASRSKQARAEPISALYEKGRIHHVGIFPPLEDQLTTWVPGNDSPDRLDALVWALTNLFPLYGEEPIEYVALPASWQ